MLFKEVYVAVLLSFLFLYGILKRRSILSGSSVILGLLYVAYRFWIIGGGLDYPQQLLGFQPYLHYLAILPYTFSANIGGYLAFCGLAAGCLWLVGAQTH